MNLEKYRDYCLSLPFVTEGMPFGEGTLVFKIGNKMFSLIDIDMFESVNLKCDPEEAIQLREKFSGVLPGYHMNKKHWNTVLTDGSISDELLKKWTLDSYELVRKGLPAKIREQLIQEEKNGGIQS